jgi:hypothetical protein
MTDTAVRAVGTSRQAAQPAPRDGASWPVALIAVFALAFLAVGHQRLTMPFGDSHDGRNGTQWGLGSRALREEGVLRSHLGADLVAGGVRVAYTDHPPLIYSETAAAEALAGEHPWATRLPAWLGSLVAVGLCYRLLRRCGVGAPAAAIGTVLGFGCPMFGAYGLMNDPWIVGLPWGLAILLLWQEQRTGAPVRWPAIAAVALVGALTSWVNVILLALLALIELVARARRRRRDVLAPIAIAGAIGIALTVLWVAWAHGGSVNSLLSQAGRRSSGSADHMTPALLVTYLRSYWVDTFTPWQLALAIPVLVAAWLQPRTRPVFGVALGTVAIWVMAFSDGAAHHDYWAYWLVVPLAIGFAAAADRVLARASTQTTAIIAAFATVVGIVGFQLPRTIPQTLRHDARAGAVLLAARERIPPHQAYVWYLGDIVQVPYWIAYPFHRPAARLVNLRAVDELASAEPNDIVLVAADRLTSDLAPADATAHCRAGVAIGQDYAVLTAATLDRELRKGPCTAAGALASRPTQSGVPTPQFVAP